MDTRIGKAFVRGNKKSPFVFDSLPHAPVRGTPESFFNHCRSLVASPSEHRGDRRGQVFIDLHTQRQHSPHQRKDDVATQGFRRIG
jgi:hypothetical protein